MQENEFEKQVHAKMEGLKFQPTQAVWEGVEGKLRKRKKRRYFFIRLPVYFAALLLAGYFTWPDYFQRQPAHQLSPGQQLSPAGENSSSLKNQTTSKTHEQNPKPGGTNVSPYNSVEAGVIPNADSDAGNTSLKKAPGSSAVVSAGPGYQKPRDNRQLRNDPNFRGVVSRNIKKQASRDQQQQQPNFPGPADRLAEGRSGEEAPLAAGQPLSIQESEGPATREIRYTAVNPELSGHDQINTALAIRSLSKKGQISLSLVNRRRPWQVGISFQAGRSGIRNGELNSLSRPADPASMPNLSASNANMYIPPSAMKRGPAFSPGIYLKKQLNYRFALTIGLNYALYTSSYQVGRRADSIIVPQAYVADQRQFAGLFRTGNNIKYINRYHFVELPVMLQTKLTGRRENGVYWDAGFSISRLVSTNALFYDNRARLYYKDDGMFNKTQWNFVTGLPVNFYSSKNISFLAGPQFQYGLTKFSSAKNPATHLLFVGLKAGILLK